jgi:pilus assembly protein CpaB
MLLMLALGCGLVASIGITQVMAKRNSGGLGNAGETLAIFVAMEDIPTGDLVTAEMLKLEEWPKDKVPEGALAKLEDIEGRRPKTKIWSGTVILDNQLLDHGESAGGGAAQIPPGYRVVSVRVDDESGISNLIRPGDRVDVLLYMKRNPGTVTETATKTIFQDIKVFAVNDIFDLERTEGQETFNAKTVSLLVTPQQMEKFTLASELGSIRLALRSHEDKAHVELAGAFPHELDEEGQESNRDMEELVRIRPGNSPSDDVDDLLAMLNRGGAKAAATPVGVEEPQRDIWTMRVVRGGEVTEVVMETEAPSPAESAQKSSSSGFNVWRMISPLRGTSPEPDANHPGAEDPAAGAEKEKQPAEGEPEPDRKDFDDG